MEKLPIEFETKHRVKFRQVDAYGHMNMAHYLTYYIDHRFEGMRKYLGLALKDLVELPYEFHVRSVNVEYIRPLFADEEFVIRSEVNEWRKASIIVGLKMANKNGELVSTCEMRIGCIDKQTNKPREWLPSMREKFFKEIT